MNSIISTALYVNFSDQFLISNIGLKPSIIMHLEAYRDDELSERREKRRKMQDKNGDKSNDALTANGERISPSSDQNIDIRPSMEVSYYIYTH